MDTNCELCKNLQGTCNLHKPKETEAERLERRGMYVARAVSMVLGADEDLVRKEAKEKFDRVNPVVEE